jgi:hypothetical protein
MRINIIHLSTGIIIMSKNSKHRHYALAQMKELRKEFVAMRDQWEKDPKAVMKYKAKLHEQHTYEATQEWEQIKRESKQLRDKRQAGEQSRLF